MQRLLEARPAPAFRRLTVLVPGIGARSETAGPVLRAELREAFIAVTPAPIVMSTAVEEFDESSVA